MTDRGNLHHNVVLEYVTFTKFLDLVRDEERGGMWKQFTLYLAELKPKTICMEG